MQHIGIHNRLIVLYDNKVKALQAEVARQKTELAQQKAEAEAIRKEAEETKRNAAVVAGKAGEKEQLIKSLKDKLEAEVTGRRNDVSTTLAANKKLLAEKAELEKGLKAAEEKLEFESQRLRKSRTDEVHKTELEMIRRANARLKRIKKNFGDLTAHSEAKTRAGEVSGLLDCLKVLEGEYGVVIPSDLKAGIAKDAAELKQKLAAIRYEPVPDVLFDLGMNDPEDVGGRSGVVIRNEHGSNARLISPQAAAQLRSDVVGSSASA